MLEVEDQLDDEVIVLYGSKDHAKPMIFATPNAIILMKTTGQEMIRSFKDQFCKYQMTVSNSFMFSVSALPPEGAFQMLTKHKRGLF